MDAVSTLVTILIFISFIASLVIAIFCLFDDRYRYFFSPNHLYKYTKMNRFGCIVCSFLVILCTPFYVIPVFIHYIFHVGRKDKK